MVLPLSPFLFHHTSLRLADRAVQLHMIWKNLGGDENDDDDSTKLKKMALFENEGSIQLTKATQQVSEAPNMVAAILLC